VLAAPARSSNGYHRVGGGLINGPLGVRTDNSDQVPRGPIRSVLHNDRRKAAPSSGA